MDQGGTLGREPSAGGGTAGRVTGLAVLAFLSELGVFALLAVSGWSLARTVALRLALALLLPLVAGTLWGLLLAPRSTRRLPQPWRLVGQLLVFAASGLLALAADLGPVAWVLPSAAGLVFCAVLVVGRRTRGLAERS